MFIEIKRILKRGACILLAVTSMVLVIKYLSKDRSTTVTEDIFKMYNRNEIIKAYGNLEKDTLQAIKRALGDSIGEFWWHGYTAAEAKEAEFEDADVFKWYGRDEILEAYGADGNLKKDTLQAIKIALGNNIEKFEKSGYTAAEAKAVGFRDIEIFNEYKRDEIVEVYGTNGQLPIETLKDIKVISGNNINNFIRRGYTAAEAKAAEFEDADVFKWYGRDEILEAYGTDGELTVETLKAIKRALRDSIGGFRRCGYTVEEARLAEFEDADVFKMYNRNEIIKVYGTEGCLNADTLKAIKRALGDDIEEFRWNGYTAADAKAVGFEDDDIFRKYARDEILKVYGTKGRLDADTLKAIKRALGNNIEKFEKSGYTAAEAKAVDFRDTEIFNEYKRDEIVEVYGTNGQLPIETLKDIKRALGDSIWGFRWNGYTVEEARLAGFKN